MKMLIHVQIGSVSKHCFQLVESGARCRSRSDFVRTNNPQVRGVLMVIQCLYKHLPFMEVKALKMAKCFILFTQAVAMLNQVIEIDPILCNVVLLNLRQQHKQFFSMQAWYEEWENEIHCCYQMNCLARNGSNSVSTQGSCHLKSCHLHFLFRVLLVLFTEVLGYRKIRHSNQFKSAFKEQYSHCNVCLAV